MFKKILLIGAGAMGKVLLDAIPSFFDAAEVSVCVRSEEKADVLREKYPSHTITLDCKTAVAGADCLFVCVKPQDFSTLAREIRDAVSKDALCVSIMAGVSTSAIQDTLGTAKVIRAMSNLPMKVRKGVLGWIATEAVSEEERRVFDQFFGILGYAVQCQSDDEIDKITAVGGSGPAYFYFIAECLMDAAVSLGLSADQADRLVRGTLVGAGALLDQSGISIPELKKQIVSKGGTTEAALKVFEDVGVRDIWKRVVGAAYARAKELGLK